MYLPPIFAEGDVATIHAAIRACRLANLVTMGRQGLVANPVPMLLEAEPQPYGTLIGHLAIANPQAADHLPEHEALAIFMGPDAYVSPSLYKTKQETGKVVPTWNYVTIQAHGKLEFFRDAAPLLDLVTRLTDRHEAGRPHPWKVADAPADFIQGQLKGIIGFRLTITRLEGKWKMSQNRPPADRQGVADGLAAADDAMTREVGALVKARNGL
ncbi:MAG TPA: FMN-binding negative transcriptional regulator [Stellaceae bacterium]|jgi:transcriptional regulator|nr:FMN-binding negative transcriptional regulator [Stellaceae bacterium]